MANPGHRLSNLPLLTASERRQILLDWNDTRRDLPEEQCIHQLFEAQVELTPEAAAVIFEDQHLSYRELNRRANRLAHHLMVLGVGPEVPVGICMERSLELVIGLLAILKAGGAYVPLDPAYPKERFAFMLEDSGAPVLLTQERLLSRLPEMTDDGRPTTDEERIAHGAERAASSPGPSVVGGLRSSFPQSAMRHVTVICLDTNWEVIAEQCAENPVTRVTPENLAYVIYTSASTGRPKGVGIPHAGLVNLVTWHQRVYGVTPTDRATQVASPAFDAAGWELWPYLTAGGSVHIPDEETVAFPSKLLRWLAAEKITICFLPTPLAEAVLEEPWPNGLALRVLLTGGDKLHRRPERALPFCLANNYGPTENSVVTTWVPDVAATESEVPPPIGRPVTNTQTYLLDSHLQPVPVGVPAELHIGGVGLARGYLNRPDLTAERFIPNPFSSEPGARLYKSGDWVRYLPDGNIEFLGRIDHQVKIRGFRIEPGEIEAVLTQHPAVREAVVIKREESAGDGRLVAYIVPQGEPSPTLAELRGFVKSRLPDYMIPSAFVTLHSLPLSPNGKLDRRALPVPGPNRPEVETFVPPRTPVEELLAMIWAQILKVDRVGMHDNFFDLGGHS
ncbi:MAG: non-ribosomal peptide synthetase, partial [Candidatus Binatia bacterium]